jgi:predicted metalloprotease with PDZ domain
VLRPVLAAAALGLAAPPLAGGAHPTFSVDYLVRISRRDPEHAHVRWLLAGIDEIRSFRLVFRDDRTSDVTGTGSLAWHGRTLLWTPGGPYAHLRYRVSIPRTRPPGPRFDSYATRDWVATRALHLFPEINVHFHEGTRAAAARARLVFRLPRGWRSAAAQEPLGDGVFAVDEPGKQFARPRGWFLLGNIRQYRRRIAGMQLTVAQAPGAAVDARRLLRLYAHTVPLLADILGPPPARLLVVSAPDPMWRGGLSGEDSFFVNGRIPLRSADKTSSYLHELFHVWQPFRPAPDGRWVSEGLAEYYSLVLPYRAGRLSERTFARGVSLFARYGRWGVDLSHTRDPAALNNSAPFLMYWLDQEIRGATDGQRSLDDVVRSLAREAGTLTTASFLRVVSRTAARDFSARFGRRVFRGERPVVTLPGETVPSARH